jgi:hypothetical protein
MLLPAHLPNPAVEPDEYGERAFSLGPAHVGVKLIAAGRRPYHVPLVMSDILRRLPAFLLDHERLADLTSSVGP